MGTDRNQCRICVIQNVLWRIRKVCLRIAVTGGAGAYPRHMTVIATEADDTTGEVVAVTFPAIRKIPSVLPEDTTVIVR